MPESIRNFSPNVSSIWGDILYTEIWPVFSLSNFTDYLDTILFCSTLSRRTGLPIGWGGVSDHNFKYQSNRFLPYKTSQLAQFGWFGKIFFNGPTPASFSFIFGLSNKYYNFYNKYM